jgi:hypothetical protein
MLLFLAFPTQSVVCKDLDGMIVHKVASETITMQAQAMEKTVRGCP